MTRASDLNLRHRLHLLLPHHLPMAERLHLVMESSVVIEYTSSYP